MSVIEITAFALSLASLFLSGISLGICLERWLRRRFLEELDVKTRRLTENLDRALTRWECR